MKEQTKTYCPPPKEISSLYAPVVNKDKRVKRVSKILATALFAASCSSPVTPPEGTGDTTGGLENKPSSQNPPELVLDKPENLILPFEGTWFVTGGPHSDGLSNGVRYAVDFAPARPVPCPGGLPQEDQFIVASESGKVTIVGDEENPKDKNHSIVEVSGESGFTLGYMHLANIQVDVGQKIKQGGKIGNPSCEVPPGGKTTGEHLHVYLEKNNKPIPIEGVVFSGWKVEESNGNYQGLLTSKSEIKTADTRRCADETICAGIRNDLESADTGNTFPEEIPLEPQDQARKFVLDKWVSYLDSAQGTDENFLIIKTSNLDTWQEKFPEILKGENFPSEPLKISIHAGMYWDVIDLAGENIGLMGGKDNIEIEIDAITVDSEGDKTEEGWRGFGTVTFVYRFRMANYRAIENGTADSNRDRVKNWIKDFNDQDLPEFTEWIGSSFGLNVESVGPNWEERETNNSPLNLSINGEGMVLPFPEIDTYIPENCTADWAGQGCKLVEIMSPPYPET